MIRSDIDAKRTLTLTNAIVLATSQSGNDRAETTYLISGFHAQMVATPDRGSVGSLRVADTSARARRW